VFSNRQIDVEKGEYKQAAKNIESKMAEMELEEEEDDEDVPIFSTELRRLGKQEGKVAK